MVYEILFQVIIGRMTHTDGRICRDKTKGIKGGGGGKWRLCGHPISTLHLFSIVLSASECVMYVLLFVVSSLSVLLK